MTKNKVTKVVSRKNIFFMLVSVFVLSVSSLHAESIYDAPKRINYSTLPKEAQMFLDTYFKDYTYLYAYEDNIYRVQFKGNTTVFFDLAGNWFGVSGYGDAIPTGFIDTKILKSVSDNYPDSKISRISKSKKKTEVKLVNGNRITMDTNGNILKVKLNKKQ